ncbi:MAG: AsmA family protein [Acidobacteria bacterium]|nr:AsmA family protein [Acidobacteriota bacterium]
MNEETPGLSRRQRQILWTLAGVGLLLILIFTPPLINVNRLQKRIAASMSASLGRTVHLDRASMHLFPVPGFTLENLIVSEDPAFGAEPVIRANSVEVALRPSSLWRRQVEFSSIKFEDPSLNLVRNAQGVWNIQSLLMHAASVPTAPTAQRKAGSAPRFPYIEATDARVNFKLGEEKKPFSLTGADFALWLPSPQEWRVRLEGQPARTDTNISDPGTVRVEGSLGKAATMAAVPVDLTASWEGAPLGEASKMMTGDDANWRGTLHVSATLVGTLGAAKLAAKVHLEELRRADFVPLQTMDVRSECSGTMDVVTAVVRDPDCSVAAPAAGGEKLAGRVVGIADAVDLSTLDSSGLRVGVTNLSNAWLLDWARLFSQRIPAGERPGGTLDGSVVFTPAPMGGAAVWMGKSWDGEIHGHIDGLMPWKPVEKNFLTHPVAVTSSAAGFSLAPVSLNAPGKTPALTLSGMATRAGYTVRLAGTATEAQMEELRARLPPLGDAMQEALPKAEASAAAATKPMRVDITCARAWGRTQTCATTAAAVPAKKPQRRP